MAARWQAVRTERRAALIPFLTAGFPTAAGFLDAARRAAHAGADFIEVGIPFSDPLADGPTIQRSTQKALDQGITPARVLELVREAALPVPVILMTYLNPVLAYGGGPARFATDARAAGAAAVLLTDAPAGAAPEAEQAIARAGLALIRLVAPTTSDERLPDVVRGAGGFIYLITRLGVTGARSETPAGLPDQVRRVRAATALPVAVGFGISTAAQVRAAASEADGVVVGSALVEALGRGGPPALEALVRELAAAVRVERKDAA